VIRWTKVFVQYLLQEFIFEKSGKPSNGSKEVSMAEIEDLESMV
jgi:hypothetical protein